MIKLNKRLKFILLRVCAKFQEKFEQFLMTSYLCTKLENLNILKKQLNRNKKKMNVIGSLKNKLSFYSMYLMRVIFWSYEEASTI